MDFTRWGGFKPRLNIDVRRSLRSGVGVGTSDGPVHYLQKTTASSADERTHGDTERRTSVRMRQRGIERHLLDVRRSFGIAIEALLIGR